MRDLVYDSIADLNIAFDVSDELPWVKGTDPLYIKNLESIFVDLDQTTQEPLWDAFDGSSGVVETTTVSVYVSNDAKLLPSDYDTTVSALRSIRLDVTFLGYVQKTTDMSTFFEGDVMVTQFDYNFNKLIN